MVHDTATQKAALLVAARFLEPEEFCRLLLSRRRLVRLGTTNTHMFLLDEASGDIVKVEEIQLKRYVETDRDFDQCSNLLPVG